MLSRYRDLSVLYSGRNETYRILRKQYQGDLTAVEKRKTSLSQTQEEPLTVYNLISASAKRFITQIASSVPSTLAVPKDLSNPKDIDIGSRRGMFLNHVWKQNEIAIKIGEMAWYQSLLGSFPIFVLPKPDSLSGFKITVGIPEFFYPVPKDSSWNEFSAVIYAYHKVGDKYEYLDFHKIDPQKGSFEDTHNNNTIIYMDAIQYIVWQNNKIIEHVRHNLGIIPCVVGKNMPIPATLTSEGDFDQAVAMQEYINEQLLAQGQIIFDFANAPIVVNSSRSVQPNLGDRLWDLGPDGKAQFLTYPGNSPSQETLFIKSQQAFEDMTAISSPALGRDIPSGTTGPVVSSLLGGFNGVLSLKQLMIGDAIRKVNLIIQQMAEVLYPNRLFPIYPSMSYQYPQTTILNKKLYIVPSEWGGFYENVVKFPEHENIRIAKNNIEITKMQMGLQSRIRTMLNLGIENPMEEIQQIILEQQGTKKEEPPGDEQLATEEAKKVMEDTGLADIAEREKAERENKILKDKESKNKKQKK